MKNKRQIPRRNSPAYPEQHQQSFSSHLQIPNYTTILQQIQKGFQKNKLFKTDKETETKLGYQIVK